MQCKIYNSLSNFYFKKNILLKYDVSFFRCSNCGFLQTETPYWLDEAYESPISAIYTGVIRHPLEMSRIAKKLILNYFNYKSKFLDYGGGNGIFVRIMRDEGLNFYRQDKYTENIFARYFDFYDLPENDRKFELITCFEVLEHLENPMDELSKMFNLGKNLFCSTALQPFSSVQELTSWGYLGDLHGQHISFYTQESMKIIAENFGCHYYSDNAGLHLFTSRKINDFSFNKDKKNISLSCKVKDKLIYLISKIYTKYFDDQEKLPSLQTLTFKDQELVEEIVRKGKSG